jgi:hypothetical protein
VFRLLTNTNIDDKNFTQGPIWMCSVKLLHYAVLFVTVAVTSFTACGGDVEVETRSIDGTGNNPDKPAWGSAGSQIGRVTTVAYGDMVSSPASATRPNPRTISNTLCDQTVSIPEYPHRMRTRHSTYRYRPVMQYSIPRQRERCS